MYANIAKQIKNNEAHPSHPEQVVFLIMGMCKDQALYVSSSLATFQDELFSHCNCF